MTAGSELLNSLLSREVVEAGVAPAATAAVATRIDGRWMAAFGSAGAVCGHPTNPDTPFDLASVTKPLFAITCARIIERYGVTWSTPLADCLPFLRDTPGGARTLAEHLSHRAGLQAHIELFAPLRHRRPIVVEDALRRAATSLRPAPAEGALYSDLGYLLVGKAIERLTEEPLDQVVTRELSSWDAFLGSSRQWRRREPRFPLQVAPTEHVPWRGGTLQGVVHDDNAWALGGYGCCGHAGLFGTAPGLLRLGVALLEHQLLSPEAREELTRPRPGGSLRMGFDGKSDDRSMAGKVAGPNTFGHLGYTGTSLWIDPDSHIVTVFLTNRVHPSAANHRIRTARPRVQDELFQFAWNSRAPSRMASVMLPLGNPAGAGE